MCIEKVDICELPYIVNVTHLGQGFLIGTGKVIVLPSKRTKAKVIALVVIKCSFSLNFELIVKSKENPHSIASNGQIERQLSL